MNSHLYILLALIPKVSRQYNDGSDVKKRLKVLNFIDTAIKRKVYLLKPMNFIGNGKNTTTKNWYIRNGALDREAVFYIAINLCIKLHSHVYNPNFALSWNIGDMGVYSLYDVFA